MSVGGPSYDDSPDGFRWRVDRREWRDYAACRGASPDLFFVEDEDGVELPYLTDEQREHCGRCHVVTDCLLAGRDEEYGVWGATTGYQRRLLGRVLSRKRCPVCSVSAVAPRDPHELCTACGHSWRVSATGP